MSETTDQTAVSQAQSNPALAPQEVNSVSKEFNYRFRKDKELGTQRAPVKIVADVPNTNGLIDIIQNDEGFNKEGKPNSKALQWVLELMEDAVRSGIGDWVSENDSAAQETFDPAKFTFVALANQPREDRRANQIPEELWKEFGEDYITIMPGLTGKTKAQAETAVVVYTKKFAPVKTNKAVVKLLKEQLALYTANTANAEKFADILEFLDKRSDTYLAADDVQQLIANL